MNTIHYKNSLKVDDRNLILTREDLNKSGSKKHIDEIGVEDIKGSYRQVMDAYTVVFIDDHSLRIRTLKSIYN
jgi:hypothetical protein